MKYFNLYIALFVLLLTSCEMVELPQAEVSKEPVFNTEAGLKLYSNSFYNILPSAQDIYLGDDMSDFIASNSINQFLTNSYGPNQASGWNWSDLRNINFFIENNTDEAVAPEVREHYMGLARFFRAFFYFEKVKRFGDVPWISQVPDINDTELLYAGRDSRTLVMDSVLADIDYACTHISKESDASSSSITKWVAYALKARICLFEGTFRKYHTELGLQASADAWLEQAAAAAKEVIDHSGYALNSSGDADMAYRNLFVSTNPVNTEVMLAVVMSQELGILHAANWKYTSPTYGVKSSLSRTFVNTYLNLDGTPFAAEAGYETKPFWEEVKERDLRLKQTIRLGDYTRVHGGQIIPAPPSFGYVLTGYQPIKWVLDDTYYDLRDYNDNSVAIFRYAEVLLNYAEAKAELGTLNDADWAMTIGALRARAGITSGLDQLPTQIDSYLQTNYFPEIGDPVILEVRRERAIELVMEGFRFNDLVRWKRGELMKMNWRGFYVPALNVPMDLNEDGIDDVIFVEQVPNPLPDVSYEFVQVGETINGEPNPQRLTNGTSGELTWLDNIPRVWNDRNYYYPIPENDVLMNPNLEQNPGWE
ncbi:RagB/SusD family nutrient uptake outer membrane protein [Sunxiuqinia rutila]|uniref:RagB/SusD family nutrient uptake outer membrane protein n=1 Tax=Sunxiuqinia rutila TaxID=1397841 RepID=UPI003D363049